MNTQPTNFDDLKLHDTVIVKSCYADLPEFCTEPLKINQINPVTKELYLGGHKALKHDPSYLYFVERKLPDVPGSYIFIDELKVSRYGFRKGVLAELELGADGDHFWNYFDEDFHEAYAESKDIARWRLAEVREA